MFLAIDLFLLINPYIRIYVLLFIYTDINLFLIILCDAKVNDNCYVQLHISSKNVRIIQLFNGDRNQTSECKEEDYFGSVSIYLIRCKYHELDYVISSESLFYESRM